MSTRFYYGQKDYIVQLNALDDVASNASSSAQGYANAAAASAAAAASSRESLLAITQSFHTGTVVDAFLYDTSKDSDGGAWRARCKHTSWENETLAPGKWLGFQTNTVAAITAGGVVGDYFQASSAYASGGFFQITNVSTNASVEIVRGNSRTFPAVALIVLEAQRIVIYDATQTTLPMWMVIKNGGTQIIGTTGQSVTAMNGEIISGYNDRLARIRFIGDVIDNVFSSAAGSFRNQNSISYRNNPTGAYTLLGYTIVNSNVADVAVTVLVDAPVDPTTGLPMLTVAVATQGGVSILKHDGTVANWMTNVGWIRGVAVDSRGWLSATGGDSVAYKSWFKYSIPTGTDNTASSTYEQGSVPARPGLDGSTGQISTVITTKSYKAFGSNSLYTKAPLQLYKENPATPTKAMVAFISNAYNSGWQVGDSKGAFLADTAVESITAPELVSNGTFVSNLAGWTATGGTMSLVSGALRLTLSAASQAVYTSVSTVVGKRYRVSLDIVTNATGKNTFLYVGSTVGGVDGVNVTIGNYALTGKTAEFVATASTMYVMVSAASDWVSGNVFDIDNVSCKLVEADRSARENALGIYGTLTKSAVALGAQLVGYSGFSSANYFEQAYSNNFDFGAGDFCVMGWLNVPAAPSIPAVMLARVGPALTGAGFELFIDQNLMLTIATTTAGFGTSSAVTSAQSFKTNMAVFVVGLRRSGVLELWINGVKDANTAASTDNVTNTSATLRAGLRQDNNLAFNGSMSLWRIGATAPSADQIAQIYRDEFQLFQPNAQCTLDGTSSTCYALSYDDSTDLLHVGTGWGRSAMRGLQRVESSVSSVSQISAISAAYGAHITAGSTAARFVEPALAMRDELKLKASINRAALRDPKPYWFTGDGSTSSFTLPYGVDLHSVYRQGMLMRDQGNDYTATTDGYRWNVAFVTTPPLNQNICLMGVKNV